MEDDGVGGYGRENDDDLTWGKAESESSIPAKGKSVKANGATKATVAGTLTSQRV